ncbi:hypothetical protein JZ751_016824 [Albula glossodonta]|uniref:DUF1736 domain-containing protein n=1 Tax=Albula glossodonta TaxID=121402 RepID=A0A8T2NXT6_9TELE|nr:hypothetical protein JZ751_016824 [Albula glossodonta]
MRAVVYKLLVECVVILQRKNLGLLLSVSLLATWGAVLLAVRLYWMGNKPPSFSNSDNPAADSPSFLTRTLTFLYLPAANMWLLLCPDTLSFDWSMDALPLLRTYTDWRNLHTIAFYVGFLLLALVGLQDLTKVRESNGKVHVSNGKLNTNGHSNHLTPEHASTESLGPVKSVENGTKNHSVLRTPLPTTENIAVFSLGLLSIPFLPATNLFFYVGFVIAERVLYIPSMGFCLLVAVGLRSLYVRLRSRLSRTMVLYCSAGLVVLYGIKTVLRNQDWNNEELLYRSGIAVNPAKGKPDPSTPIPHPVVEDPGY